MAASGSAARPWLLPVLLFACCLPVPSTSREKDLRFHSSSVCKHSSSRGLPGGCGTRGPPAPGSPPPSLRPSPAMAGFRRLVPTGSAPVSVVSLLCRGGDAAQSLRVYFWAVIEGNRPILKHAVGAAGKSVLKEKARKNVKKNIMDKSDTGKGKNSAHCRCATPHDG